MKMRIRFVYICVIEYLLYSAYGVEVEYLGSSSTLLLLLILHHVEEEEHGLCVVLVTHLCGNSF